MHSKRQKTRKRSKSTTVRFKPAKQVSTEVYWPDRIDYVKAVAAQGLNDMEMAAYLGVPETLLESWKAYYPLFAKAIEEGRSRADVEVIQALHKNAIGYDYETDIVVRTRRGAEVVTAKQHVPADTNAQKFWLTNRSPNWRQGQNIGVGGRKDAPPIGVTVESKAMVIHSILNMITPRPDGDGRAPKVIEQE